MGRLDVGGSTTDGVSIGIGMHISNILGFVGGEVESLCFSLDGG